MGLLDRLFGRRRSDGYHDPGYQQAAPQYGGHQASPPPQGGAPTDQQAVERYRYLLRTAPPDKIEEAHAEAFAQLTPQQDRKSTRLNSSHANISYAVFCLKKNK